MTQPDAGHPTDALNAFGDTAGLIDAMQRSPWVGDPMLGGLPQAVMRDTLPTANVGRHGRIIFIKGASGVADEAYICLKNAADAYNWVRLPNASDMPDLTAVDFLVGTATGLLSGEIVAGTAPGGELGGTWASPTVDATHSGSAHIVLPAGELGGTNSAPTVATAHATGKHVQVLRASNTSEVTTTSTSATDLLTISGLSIPVTSGFVIRGVARKSSGAAALASLGLTLNAVAVCVADNGADQLWQSTATNGAEAGLFEFTYYPRSVDYPNSVVAMAALTAGTITLPYFHNGMPDANLHNATLTSVTIRGITASASQTLAVKEVAVYEVFYA